MVDVSEDVARHRSVHCAAVAEFHNVDAALMSRAPSSFPL
jgi:hypothetical protein